MADAKPAGKKSHPKKEENTNVTYACDKVALLKKHPKLEKAIDAEAKKGWKQVIVLSDGGLDCK